MADTNAASAASPTRSYADVQADLPAATQAHQSALTILAGAKAAEQVARTKVSDLLSEGHSLLEAARKDLDAMGSYLENKAEAVGQAVVNDATAVVNAVTGAV